MSKIFNDFESYNMSDNSFQHLAKTLYHPFLHTDLLRSASVSPVCSTLYYISVYGQQLFIQQYRQQYSSEFTKLSLELSSSIILSSQVIPLMDAVATEIYSTMFVEEEMEFGAESLHTVQVS